jgi:nucleolar protein 14
MDPDRERAERNKLRKRVRRELKGAVRELRKDGAFMEAQQAEQLRRQRAVRDERAKAIESFLAQQQFEAKIGTGRGKRRR